jgi:double-strand break repair protein AddB
MSVRDYRTLFGTLLEREEVRDPDAPHPGVMIWGTLEARVQGAELVILGGLNEGTWPEMPAPDPWLNRRMRRDAGLLLPERRIGLSAHDFQQAIAAAEVVLSRATRDESSEPVPSRWLNRLTNLLDGLTQTGGPEAMKAMRHRGQGWISRAVRLESPEAGDAVAPEPRPSPRPPLAMRPRRLSVTSIETLIRDPYAIYARHILKLKPLDPLRPDPSALEKGRVVHTVFERFMRDWSDELPVDHRAHLLDIARAVVTEEVHWPVARQLWYAQIEALADWFIGQERFHAQKKTFLASESGGELVLDAQDFTLHGRADRIDRAPGSGLVILDYKTGSVPSAKTMQYFDVQLLLEALIAEAGGFEDLPAETVSKVGYIGLGASPKYDLHDLVDKGERRFATQSVQADLIRLLSAYDQPGRGYTARRAMHKVRFEGDYDHLARFGEWSDSDPSHGIDLK